MPASDRSPFAALLVAHRHRLGLSQAQLADRTERLVDEGQLTRAVSERTIIALERATGERPRLPRPATVRALALALDLAPGTPAHVAFVAAAAEAMSVTVPPESARRDEPDADFIVAGREPQLARLLDAVAAAAGGEPQVALVTAEAGAGKTRLLDEVCRRAIAGHPGLAVLWTACRGRLGTAPSHEPFRAMVDLVVRDPLAEDHWPLPGENGRRLDARLPGAVRALTSGAEPLIGTLLDPAALARPALLDALDPDLEQRVERAAERSTSQPVAQPRIDAAIVHLLVDYARSGPLVLVVEDLHWADDATIATLLRLVDQLAVQRLPMLLLGSVRTGANVPELLRRLLERAAERFPGAVVDLSTAVGGEAGRAFVAAAVARHHEAGDGALAQRLFARTGGLPLFVMSFLRLRATSPDTPDGEIPGEIESVFARQLGRLDDASRDLLAAASVQGDEFLAEIAADVAGSGTDALDTSLAAMVVPLRADAADGALHRYRFAHALLRDYVYADTLSDLHRAHLHAATAAALVDRLGEEGHDAVAATALHRERAGDTPGAARAWLHAAERAMLASDFTRAHRIFEHVRGIDRARLDPAFRLQALIGIGNCERGMARPRRARRILRQAGEETRRLGLHAIHANALTSLGVLDFDAGDMTAGAARFAEAIEAYRQAGEIAETGRTTANLSFALQGMGRYDEARARAVEAIALGREAGDPAVRASGEIALANCWLDLGAFERAIAIYADCRKRAEAHVLVHHANLCILNSALGDIELERWDAADATLDLLRDPERAVVDRLRSVVAFNGGLVAEGRGELDRARRRYDAAREIRDRLGQEPLLIDALAGLLRVATAAGERAEARALLGDLERRVADRGYIGYIGIEHLGRLFLALVEASHMLGHPTRANRWLREALTLLDARAAGLADPDERRRYLTRPPAHRRLRALARDHGRESPSDQHEQHEPE